MYTVTRSLDCNPVEIPTERVYESEEKAELDRKLCEALELADDMGNDYLTHLLACEIGSVYYTSR